MRDAYNKNGLDDEGADGGNAPSRMFKLELPLNLVGREIC